MPALFGLQRTQDHLLTTLEAGFQAVSNEYKIPLGDFPEADSYRETMRDWIDRGQTMARLPCDNPTLWDDLNASLETDISSLMKNRGAETRGVLNPHPPTPNPLLNPKL